MVLYTDEARESWKTEAARLREKVGEIRGDALSYRDARILANILSMFCEYVDKENS